MYLKTVILVLPSCSPNLYALNFFSVVPLKTPVVFSCNWKWRGISPMHCWCLSNRLQPLWDFSRFV